MDVCRACGDPLAVGEIDRTARRVSCAQCGARYDLPAELPAADPTRVASDLALVLDESRPPPMLADVSGGGVTRAIDIFDLAPMKWREKLIRGGIWTAIMAAAVTAIVLSTGGIPGRATYYALMGLGAALAVGVSAPLRYRPRRIELDAGGLRERKGERTIVEARIRDIEYLAAAEDRIEVGIRDGRVLLLAARTNLSARDLGWLADHLRRGLALVRASESEATTVPRLPAGRSQAGSGTSR